jgi:inorganic pyrophosphatase
VTRSSSNSLADPIRLNPAEKEDGLVQVIVETPKGSRNKFAYDPQQKIFVLSRVLPAGMVFPLDFGFLPRTAAPDGDPVDALLMMDEPAYPGIAVKARLIGIMEGEQVEQDGSSSRNDRLLCVAEATQTYSDIVKLEQVPKILRSQLEEFFANYHRIQGRQYKSLGWKDADAAARSIKELSSSRAWRNQ